MNWKILKDGETVNTIVGGESFVSAWCGKKGYTYEEIPEAEEESEPVSELEQLRADVDYIAIMTGVDL